MFAIMQIIHVINRHVLITEVQHHAHLWFYHSSLEKSNNVNGQQIKILVSI